MDHRSANRISVSKEATAATDAAVPIESLVTPVLSSASTASVDIDSPQ